MNYVVEVIKLLKSKNYTISFAESITGGLLAASLVKYPGVSSIHKGSVITYSIESKVKILEVSPQTIRENSVISDATSFEMANGLYKLTNANISCAITGNAGPTYDIDTNKLECYLCIRYNENYFEYHLDYPKTKREAILKKLVKVVYKVIYNLLKEQ